MSGPTAPSGTSPSVDAGPARAWAWVAHLRAGGTTAWSSWTGGTGAEGGRFLPGAQQLELLRRLNATGRPSPALVERVLAASAPGRGRPDLELVGVDETRRFGPPAVDPARLPDVELLRVATGLLAEDLVAARIPGVDRRAGRDRRWRVRYQLAGDPWAAASLTRVLTAGGRPPGGAGRSVYVLGADLPTLLAGTWSAAAFGAAAPAWPDFLAKVRARRRLPRRVDLPGVAERLRARPHTGRVAVVLDLDALPRLVGVRRLPPVVRPALRVAELARQVGIALSLHVPPSDQALLLTDQLLPRVEQVPGPVPEVPPEHRDWVADAAFAMRQRLLRAGYPVVGDPDVLLPTWAPPTRTPGPAGSVLDLAVELLLRGDAP